MVSVGKFDIYNAYYLSVQILTIGSFCRFKNFRVNYILSEVI